MEASKYAQPSSTNVIDPYSQQQHNSPLQQLTAPQPFHSTSAALSPEATPASPAVESQDAPPTTLEVPDMGAFAQTRPPDDLFSDDFTPLAEPLIEHPDSLATSANRPNGVQVQVSKPTSLHQQHKHGAPNQRKPHPNKPSKPPTANTTAKSQSPIDTNPKQAPSDRATTGGPSKPRLTTSELDAKMAEMKLKNTELEQAHARSQADAESFRANEAVAREKQRQDRVNRQAMLGERERNAQRKMQAQHGRDWDAQKQEMDVIDRPQRRPMRGAHGGVARDGAQVNGAQDENVGAQTRGGLRGRGRGRDGGRGGRGGIRNEAQPQVMPGAGDFPALSGSGEKSAGKIDTSVATSQPQPSRVDSYGASTTPAGEQSSWADQMETNSPAWGGEAGAQVQEAKAPKGGW